jgi:hypothetical protein
VSARESIENLWDRATPVAPLLDQYAHELAELQRLRMEELDLTGQKARFVGRIIDLIDPKKESNG